MNAANHPASTKQISAISGLRAISILAVLIYHIYSAALPGGFAGVDFFFVISGFVVSMTMANYREQRFLGFIVGFYRRRITRVMPALLVFLLISLVVSNLLIPKSFLLANSSKTGLFAILGASNLFLWKSAGDYFAPTTELNFFTHTWSLAVEEQFYLIYPVIAFFVISVASRPIWKRLALIVLAAAGLASVLAAAWLTRASQSFAFYMIVTRFWELAAGALLYHARMRGFDVQARPGWAGLMGMMLVASFVTPTVTTFPFPGAVPAVLTAVLLVHTAVNHPGCLTSRVLSLSPLVYVGSISYSLYLWHWFFVVLARWTFGLETMPEMIFVAIASVLAGMASYHLVENPVRRIGLVRRTSGLAFFAVFAVLMAGSIFIGYSVSTHMQGMKLSVTKDAQVWYPYLSEGGIPASAACRVEVDERDVAFGHRTVLTPQDCAQVKAGRILVIGDSHAGAYARMMYRVAGSRNRSVTIYELRSCNPFRFANYGATDSEDCLSFIRSVIADFAASDNEGDILFLPALRVKRYRDIGEETILETADLPDAAKTEAADLVTMKARIADLAPLVERGATIVLEEPTPLFRSAPVLCADWYMRGKTYCSEMGDIASAEEKVRSLYGRKILYAAAAELPKVAIWDGFSVLCPGVSCSLHRDGKPLFFDGDHLSGYANDILLPSFLNLIDTKN